MQMLMYATMRYGHGTCPEKSPIAWVPDGSAFVINDWTRSCDQIVSHSSFNLRSNGTGPKLKSFVRKLYRYGFRQFQYQPTKALRQRIAFRHPFFHREKPWLMKEVQLQREENFGLFSSVEPVLTSGQIDESAAAAESPVFITGKTVPLKKRRLREDFEAHLRDAKATSESQKMISHRTEGTSQQMLLQAGLDIDLDQPRSSHGVRDVMTK
jgi:hypothetical protein